VLRSRSSDIPSSSGAAKAGLRICIGICHGDQMGGELVCLRLVFAAIRRLRHGCGESR